MIYLMQTLREAFEVIKKHERVRPIGTKEAYYGTCLDLHHDLEIDFTKVARLNDALKSINNEPIEAKINSWKAAHPSYSIEVHYTKTRHYYTLPHHGLFLPYCRANSYEEYYASRSKHWSDEVINNELMKVAELLRSFDKLIEDIKAWLISQVVGVADKDYLERFINRNIDDNDLNPRYIIHLLLQYVPTDDYKKIEKIIKSVL